MTKLKQKKWAGRLLVPSLFLGIAAVMLGPAWGSGQLFLLDMTWPAQLQLQAYFANGVSLHAPLMVILWVLNLLIPAWLLQKLLLAGILFAAGLGMYSLQVKLRAKKPYAAIGGILYMCNPYILDRLLAGQWLVMAGYAYLPFFAYILLAAHTNPSKKTVSKVVAAWLAYLSISVHFWYMVTLLLLPYTLYVLAKHAVPKKAYKHMKALDVALGMLLAMSILLVASIKYLQTIKVFSQADFIAFATRSLDNSGGFLTVLSLRGFWFSDGLVPHSLVQLWVGLQLVILLSVLYGLMLLAKKHKPLAAYVAVILIFCTVIAVGYAGNATAHFVDVVRSILPAFNGLRETQKFVGIIAFIYALGGPLTAQYVLQRHRQVGRIAVVAFTLLYALTMGAVVQVGYTKLQPYQYPSDWPVVQNLINADDVQKVVVIPYNGYITLPFAGYAYQANPAPSYFGPKLYSRQNADNPVLDQARGLSALDTAVLSLKTNTPDYMYLKNNGFTHILLLQWGDYLQYQAMLAVGTANMFSGPNLTLYKIQ